MNILITGKNSFVGNSFYDYITKFDGYKVDKVSLRETSLDSIDFSKYDVVLHVAGIAHSDTHKVSEDRKKEYYKVNTDLTYEVAKKAKDANVKQFIYMSSILIYNGCDTECITKDTTPKPLNFYADSKWQAEIKLKEFDNVCILRPPMIYGEKCKGNYQKLVKLAKILPFFPDIKNKRSMIHIDNLCKFIKDCIDNKKIGVFYPQDNIYHSTSEMVKEINKRIILVPFPNCLNKMFKKVSKVYNKAFGNLYYE